MAAVGSLVVELSADATETLRAFVRAQAAIERRFGRTRSMPPFYPYEDEAEIPEEILQDIDTVLPWVEADGSPAIRGAVRRLWCLCNPGEDPEECDAP